MEFTNSTYTKYDDKDEQSLHNSTNGSHETTHINDQNHLREEHETDIELENSSPRERHGDASNGEAIKVSGKTQDIQFLKSLMVFCTNVSVVGLSYVVNTSASAFRRSVWVLLVLFGVAFTTYQIQDRIRYYFDYPVSVIIQEEYMEEMIFPSVTICNENRLSLSKLSSMGKCRSQSYDFPTLSFYSPV